MRNWLRQRAAGMPDRLAIVAGDLRMTFADLDRAADDAARRLATHGVGRGTRVALLMRGGGFAVVVHALARLGAVVVPIHPRLTPREAAAQVAHARAALILHDEALAGTAVDAARNVPAGGVAALGLDVLAKSAAAEVVLQEDVDLALPQGILFTSGTSGRAKGAMLSFANHWWNAVASAFNLGVHRDDRWLAPLPLAHVGGLAILWRSVIYGIPTVIHDAFDPDLVNRDIDDGATIVSVVSTMLARMLEAQGGRPYPSSLRCVLLGGGPAPASLIERCLGLRVPVAPTYGLTEAASQVATLAPDEVAWKPGSAGRPLLPIDVRIDDGEICVRGPTVMMGYADRPDETAQVVRDGWLRTADEGTLDAHGYLYIADRREDLIVTGGENVYPAEVEAALLAHPAIEDAAVVGLPDPEWGQRVVAAVCPRACETIVEDDVRAFCRLRLAAFKIPRRVYIVNDIPRSPGGKLLRRQVRERLLAAEGTRVS